jgi:hypothetical protein
MNSEPSINDPHQETTRMKTNSLLLLTLALGVSTCALNAQEGNQRPGGPRPPGRIGGPGGPDGQGGPGGPRPHPPLIAALDANHDGIIDAAEIANASAALRTLDVNGDGNLTPDELRPPHPGGPGEQGGPGGPRPGPGNGNRPQRPQPPRQ